MRSRPDSLHRLAGLRRPDDADQLVPIDSRVDNGPPTPGPSPTWPSAADLGLPTIGLPVDPSPALLGGWTPDSDAFWNPEVGQPADSADGRPGQRAEPEPDSDQLGRPLVVIPGIRSTPRTRRWTRLTQRWVPEPLRDSRVDPGRRAAMLLVLVAAVAAVAAAIGVWRDRPEPRPVQAVSLSQVTDATMTGLMQPTGQVGGTIRTAAATESVRQSAVSTPEHPSVLVVSVTGAVSRPGLVRLSAGSRVADAIAKAGGATRAADLTGLNLAAVLSDGDSVVIADSAAAAQGTRSSAFLSAGSGSAGSGSGSGAGSTSTGLRAAAKLNINTADAAALDELPGVGPVTASNIVAWRQKNGHFTSVEQLQEISGIGPAKYAALAPQVTL